MKTLNKTLLSMAVGVAMVAGSQAMAGVEANIGAASNYLWRGVTQTNDGAAISGGLDWSNDTGLYVGTWASNVSWTTPAGYELDLYAGYGGELGSGMGYDVGYIAYLYPIGDANSDFSEVYANLSYGPVTGSVSYQVDADATEENYLYLALSADFDIAEDIGLSLYGGDYDFGDDDGSYTHFGASVSKGDFAFAIDKTDQDDAAGDPRVTVSWSTSF